MRNRFRTLVVVLVFSVWVALQTDRLSAATYRIVETLEVDTVPSWFPVGHRQYYEACRLNNGLGEYGPTRKVARVIPGVGHRQRPPQPVARSTPTPWFRGEK